MRMVSIGRRTVTPVEQWCREAPDPPEPLAREADVHLGRELVPEAAGAATRGAEPEAMLALEQEDVGHAVRREVIGGEGAHRAPTEAHRARRPHRLNRTSSGRPGEALRCRVMRALLLWMARNRWL